MSAAFLRCLEFVVHQVWIKGKFGSKPSIKEPAGRVKASGVAFWG
jgi:hypothetical protein